MRSRVALLDLRARADVFISDGGLSQLAARLSRAGHEVARLEAIGPEAPALRAEWVASLAREVGEGRFDAVILARAWDRDTLEALRGAIGDAKLLRLSSGVAGALDGLFDAVVDEAGVHALLAGEPLPAPRPRPRSARELRALRVLEVGEPDPTTAGERPAIRGPASGCPYLADAAKQPAFARLALDRDAVQTRGCTFCLDNHGAYAAFGEDETVESWLAQLRSLRAARPAGRLEVLLVDERPHPHLPRLFREIARDPALGALELLVKSRVDWLLEHERELAEACALAEASESILHVYLVGFESFDPETLALFNKGTTVDDNVQAIALLRELARRFPRTFEHRRLRAHGFVAFTPWTTPEALLRNARAMREVGFDELRAEAARTRLRLYPRTPLYALAEADGLLADDFGARGDRAAEQGYDASFAWRFADPRVEAIFAICERLHAFSRDLGDADLIELATRFVLRWPGLAAAPDIAHLPLVQAIRSWGMRPADVAALLGVAAMVDLELERLDVGEKRALLKEAVPSSDAEDLVRAYEAMGFSSTIVERHGWDAIGNAHTDSAAMSIVAVCRRDDIDEVARLQRARDVPAMGTLMGYPACCVEAFVEQPDRRDNGVNERATLRRSGDAPVHPLLVRLGRLRLVSHHPCRVDCAPSIAIAERALRVIAEVSPEHARRAREELGRPVLFLDHARAALLSGRWAGARFELEAFAPIRWEGREPQDVAAVELERDRAFLITATGERRAMTADRPVLVVPGEPLAPALRSSLAEEPPGPERIAQPLRWLELTPDYRCNQRCLGCGVTDDGPSLSSEELVRALADGRRAGITQLWIGGGEPTLRRDLLPLVREARRRGYARVRLQTNAAMLAYPDVVRRLAEAGVTEVAASIKGPDAETHDRMTRTPGSFDLLCRGIENARAAGLSVDADVLLYRSTTASLPETMRAFFERGIERFRVWMMAPDPGDRDALAEEPRWSEVADAIGRALALRLSDGPEHLLSLHSPPCTLVGGAARARFFAPELGLVIHDASGRRFRLESSEIEGGAWSRRCDGCSLRPRCNGVRAGYLARHGDAELGPQ